MNVISKITKTRPILIVASLLIAAGYLLMGGSTDADIFSTRRIAVAPTVCLVGYLLIVVGILRKK